MIMRLKMFFTPQLCIVAALLGNKKVNAEKLLKCFKYNKCHLITKGPQCHPFFKVPNYLSSTNNVGLIFNISFQFVPILRDNERWHAAFLVGLVACMSFKGIANVQHQRSISGELSMRCYFDRYFMHGFFVQKFTQSFFVLTF